MAAMKRKAAARGSPKRGPVLYLHYGPQCFAWDYMRDGAAEFAGMLGRRLAVIDVSRKPRYARRYRMFFPGMIVAGGFSMVFPGSAAQLLAAYKARGPIPGDALDAIAPDAPADSFKAVQPCEIGGCARLCLPGAPPQAYSEKAAWIAERSRRLRGMSGCHVAESGGKPVAAVEYVRASECPYPIPRRPEPGLFITCLYGLEDEAVSRRGALLDELAVRAADAGFGSLCAVAGAVTPYPNGPASLFEARGFYAAADLGAAVLRNRVERLSFMVRPLRSPSGA
jgi:hypothetical protein